jgi:predicted transcriptional regulator
LREEWPLSLKEIYFCIVREHGLNISYQAVHKALKQLVESRVLEKREKRYCLSIEWIREIRRFGERMKKEYKCNEKTAANTIKEFEKEIQAAKG